MGRGLLMPTAREVNRLINEYQSRFWDEDHPDYNEDLEDDGIRNLWDYFLYDTKPAPVDIPGLGSVEYVTDGRELTTSDEKTRFVIVRVGDQHFRMDGWEDSWGGDSGWDGPFVEVVQREVTKTVWEKV
jgi:hypothetical protein